MDDTDEEVDVSPQKKKKYENRKSSNVQERNEYKKPTVSNDDFKTLSKQERKQLRKNRKQEKLLQQLIKKKEEDVQMSSNATGENTKGMKDKSRSKGRSYTVSIAVAGSIMDNAQSPVLQSYLAGQVARAAAIFNVDEIIIFDDTGGHSTEACEHMARILQVLECPQYLRRILFPIHAQLQYTGVTSPLDLPHHLRKNEALAYREGVVTNKPVIDGSQSCFVNVGLERDCLVDRSLPPGVRVTVKFDNSNPTYILNRKGKLKGKLVSPHHPRTESGLYWGYSVRIAKGLAQVFSQCPFSKGYDITIGTSDKGSPVDTIQISSFNHLLIVFGGVEGLEYALDNDETLRESEVSDLFQYYINTCLGQGSRTIRTEEAILISLTALNPVIHPQS